MFGRVNELLINSEKASIYSIIWGKNIERFLCFRFSM